MREFNRREFLDKAVDFAKKGATATVGLGVLQNLNTETAFGEAKAPERIKILQARSAGRVPGGIIAGWDGDNRLAVVYLHVDTQARLHHIHDDNVKELDPVELKRLLDEKRLRERASFDIIGLYVDEVEIGPDAGNWKISDLVLAKEVDITI